MTSSHTSVIRDNPLSTSYSGLGAQHYSSTRHVPQSPLQTHVYRSLADIRASGLQGIRTSSPDSINVTLYRTYSLVSLAHQNAVILLNLNKIYIYISSVEVTSGLGFQSLTDSIKQTSARSKLPIPTPSFGIQQNKRTLVNGNIHIL
jgi:hypothetical protein